MKSLPKTDRKTAETLLSACLAMQENGFSVDLSERAEQWDALSRSVGTTRLCAFVAEALSARYEAAYQKPFLFSVPCMTFELRYHLNAYLCVKGFRHVRHVSTLLIGKDVIERKCRSIEIDAADVYRIGQRLAFRYFFGIRKPYRRTEHDPYAKQIGNRFVRIPFYRLFGAR